MDDKTKNIFDALQALNNQGWAEFQEKTKLEWRLSFGIWTVLVTTIGSILAGKVVDINIVDSSKMIRGFYFILWCLHLWFLIWIQGALTKAREHLYIIRDNMWSILNLKKPKIERNTFKNKIDKICSMLNLEKPTLDRKTSKLSDIIGDKMWNLLNHKKLPMYFKIFKPSPLVQIGITTLLMAILFLLLQT